MTLEQLNAKEARKVSLKQSKEDKNVEAQYLEVVKCIEKACEKGEFLIKFNNLLPALQEDLIDNGFIVRVLGFMQKIHTETEYEIRW